MIYETATFKPSTIPFPRVRLKDYLRQATTYIITILTQPSVENNSSLSKGGVTSNTLS